MMRYILVCLLFTLCVYASKAQELDARLTINTSQVRNMEQTLIKSLEESVNTLLNEHKWTATTFSKSERISCIVVITIKDMPAENSFKAEIQVTANRPVYNSSYTTPLFNFKDSEFEFNYTQGESLEFNEYGVTSNLIATIAYYANLVIGLDFDSFSPNGGRTYFDKAMSIANTAQSLNTPGWKPFSGRASRYDLAVALTEESSRDFHKMWYSYHRLGLDVMESDASRGRIRIMESIDDLGKVHSARPNSALMAVFADTKLDELLKICSKATDSEKEEIKKKLQLFFPARANQIRELK